MLTYPTPTHEWPGIPPKTRKKLTDQRGKEYEVNKYTVNDGITHKDEQRKEQEYVYKGEQLTLSCQTDIDLVGQIETRQSTSSLVVFLNGAVVHYRAATERIIIQSTAAGEYIALSRGNTTTKFIRDILIFYGNTQNVYYLYTDNQAAEHIATQPNMNEHSRSIDIRHHAIRQDYVDGLMRIGGVDTLENTSDLLTKTLHPPQHQRHARHLHLQENTALTNTTTTLKICATNATLKTHNGRTSIPRKPIKQSSCPSWTIILRPQPTHWHTPHCTHQNLQFGSKTNPKSPNFLSQIYCGYKHDARRQPDRDRQCPSRYPIPRRRQTQQNHLPPYKPPATMAQIPQKTSENHPKNRHDRRGDKGKHNLRPHHPHQAHNPMCPTPTPMCPTHRPPAPHTKHKINTHLAHIWTPPSHLSHATLNVFVNDGRRLQTKTCVETGFLEK